MTLKDLRIRNNLTQVQLGKAVGLKQVAISQYERGITIPKLDVSKKLASVLSVSLDELNDALEKSYEYTRGAVGNIEKNG